MAELEKRTKITEAIPIVFGDTRARCFGWFHRANGDARSVGVVLC